jgi:putative nucleotidyltransferase with HDIG domain
MPEHAPQAESLPLSPQENLEALVKEVKDLPPLPAVIMRAMEAVQNPDVPILTLQRLISQDQALSAKILKIVNSAMYSLRCEVSTVSHAVSVLGINTVKAVIMAASVEWIFHTMKDLSQKLMAEHSWGVALAARTIARRVGYANIEEALISGLMHDIGKPVMMKNMPDRYETILSEVYGNRAGFYEQEMAIFEFSHAHVGALLAKRWNFPPQLIESVRYHHEPDAAPEYPQLAHIVNIGNLLMVKQGIGFEKDSELLPEKTSSAEALKLDEADLRDVLAEVETMLDATTALRK